MRASDIQIDEIYKIKNSPYFFKPIEILKPKEKENVNNYIIVKGWYSTTENDFSFALRKYFKPVNIIRNEH